MTIVTNAQKSQRVNQGGFGRLGLEVEGMAGFFACISCNPAAITFTESDALPASLQATLLTLYR